MTTAATHRLDERCHLCSSQEDVRLVQPLLTRVVNCRVYGRAIALCAKCRGESQRKWKWPSYGAARSAEYARDMEVKL